MGIGKKLGDMMRRAAAGRETEIAEEVARLRGLRSREDIAAYAREKGAAAKELLQERGPELKDALRKGWDELLKQARGGSDPDKR
ncbi:MAG: hypothetical protein AB1916_12280 [Thermodesulfobacteriota bacterium]